MSPAQRASLARCAAAITMTSILLAGCGESLDTGEPTPPPTAVVVTGATGAETVPAGGGTTASGDAEAGKAVFGSAGCTGCHTLADAGSTGTVGPNLDKTKPSEALVRDRVTNGMGQMPSFKDQLSEDEIRNLAAYVAQAS